MERLCFEWHRELKETSGARVLELCCGRESSTACFHKKIIEAAQLVEQLLRIRSVTDSVVVLLNSPISSSYL